MVDILNTHTFKYSMNDGATLFLRSKLCNSESWKLGEKWKSTNLFFILSGQVRVECKNSENRLLKPSSMYLAVNTSDYLFTALEDTEIFVVSSNKITQSLVPVNSNSRVRKIAVGTEIEMRGLMFDFVNNLSKHIEEGYLNDDMCALKLNELLLLIRLLYSEEEYELLFGKILGKDVDFVSRVLRDWEKVRNASELAKHFGMGEKTLQRMFKLHFNATPYNWMQREKAEIIGLMLRNKNIPIKNIIDDYDFSSRSHFNSYCKKMYGGTPLQVRNYLNDEERR